MKVNKNRIKLLHILKTFSPHYKSEKNLEKICVRHNNDFVLMYIEQTLQEELDQIDKEVLGTYLCKTASCNSIKFLVNLNDFRFNKKINY